MDLKEFRASIRGGESDRLEFKREARDLRAVGRAVCAFANSSGGLVVIGVDDRGGIVGVDEDPDRLQERLTTLLHTGLSTPVSARCGCLDTPAGSPVSLDVLRDRVLVTSPGALPNRMTVESVRAGGRPRSRNQLMVNAVAVAGLMERRGRGWLLMKEAMAGFNLPEPEMENDRDGRTVRVTLLLDGQAGAARSARQPRRSP